MPARLLAVSATVLILTGCQTTPLPLAAPPDTVVPQALHGANLTLASAGRWHVALDTAALTATATPVIERRASETDDLYLLSLERFIKPAQFVIDAVDRDPTTGWVVLTYTISHPFPAPADPAGTPNGKTNRADLGFGGITMFLFDVASPEGNTYFTDRIVNTTAAAATDGYYSPGDASATGTIANTFPFQSVVRETTGGGSRLGISNGDVVTGNYGADGWTRSEFGPSNDGWTGYGVLHAGQRSQRQFTINNAVVHSTTIEFDALILARYQDPRGGATPAEQVANRLPPPTADPALFAYRMPHGAWDLPRIVPRTVANTLMPGEASSTTVPVSVSDWDLYATPTTLPDLADDPDVTHVVPGAEGLPAIALCVPGVLGDPTVVQNWDPVADLVDDDTAYGGDVAADSGLPGDAVLFTHDITLPADNDVKSGLYTGLMRFTDPEVALNEAYILELSPTLVPLTSNRPRPVVYQTTTLRVRGDTWTRKVAPETGPLVMDLKTGSHGMTVICGLINTPTDLGFGTWTPTGNADYMIAAYDEDAFPMWDWVESSSTNTANELVQQVAFGLNDTVWATGTFTGTLDVGGGPMSSGADSDIFVLHLDNGGGYLGSFQLGDPDVEDRVTDLVVDSAGKIVITGRADGATTLFGSELTSGSADDAGFVARGEPSGTGLLWGYRAAAPGDAWADFLAVDSADEITVGGWYRGGNLNIAGQSFPPFAGTAGTTYLVKFSSTGTYRWGTTWGSSDPSGAALLRGLCVNDEGHLFGTGWHFRRVDFGGGPRDVFSGLVPTFVASYDGDSGDWRWDRKFGTPDGGSRPGGIGATPDGGVVVVGNVFGTVDFGGGLRTVPDGTTGFITALSSEGTWRWDIVWEENDALDMTRIQAAEDGSLRAVGSYTPPVDMNPTGGVETLSDGDHCVIRLNGDGNY